MNTEIFAQTNSTFRLIILGESLPFLVILSHNETKFLYVADKEKSRSSKYKEQILLPKIFLSNLLLTAMTR